MNTLRSLFVTGIIAVCLFFSPAAKAQQDTAIDYAALGVDTTALYDSLLNELRMLGLAGASKKSYFDVNVGMGNGTFALQNASFDVSTNHIFYNAGLGYYHKSGLSVSAGANFTNSNGSLSVYQQYISPAFDFRNKKVAAGISYFHYFNKKDVDFYISPLVNELYAYTVLKKSWLQPKLALDYAWGQYDELEGLKFIDTVRYRRFAPIVRYLSRQQRIANVSDFSIMFSVRHDFIHTSEKHPKLFFRYTPSLLVLGGTATYGSNTPLNSLNGPRMTNLTNVQYFQSLYGDAFTPPSTSFALQNFNITNAAMLGVGAFYIQGQLTLSYIIPKAQSRWNTFFNLTTGVSF